MSDPDRAREPSMEEILASIRRIISDDKKDPQTENNEAPAPPRAGESPGRSEPAETWDPARQEKASQRPAAGGDVFAATSTEAHELSAAALEEGGAEEPEREAGAGRAEEPNEPAQEPMHEPAGRFAAPEPRYRAMTETSPEGTGFRERERDPGPSFELRGASDDEAASRRASAFEPRETPAPQEPTTTTEEPAAEQEAAPAEEPAAAQQPAISEEPAAVEEPSATEELPTTEEQPTVQEASAMEEPVGGEPQTAMEGPTQIEEQSRLVSTRTDAEVASAFAQLEDFVLSTHSRSLEDLVSEMLRPLLKEWLDANLPPLVERLVREEIERVSRGRR